MSARNQETKAVFPLTERGGQNLLDADRCPVLEQRRVQQCNLDALPVSGRLRIREQEDRDERQKRGGREERR
jgi:hypothetical protein